MKKVLALALAAAMALSMVACGSSEPTAPAVTYKTGLGAVVEAETTDATAEAGASAQITSTIVAATFDSNDVIVSIDVDAAQQKATFDLEGKLAGEVDLRTKVEKEGDYGMLKVSAIGKEYFEQAKAYTEWMTGKTVAEVLEMPTYERDASHTACPDVEELKASCTITVGDYLKAFAEATK